MTVTAAVTDHLVNFAVSVIRDLGLPGVFVLMLLESACIPIPSEATMLFAGFNVADGHWSLVTVVGIGVLGNLVGSWVAYAVGYFGRVEWLERHGGKLHIKASHLETADRWFERYGSATVFFCRLLPLVRTFISLPAGAARMPFWRFTALTLAGCVPWVLALTLIGKGAGASWHRWRDHLQYLDYAVVAAVIVGIVYLVVRWRARRRSGGATAADVA